MARIASRIFFPSLVSWIKGSPRSALGILSTDAVGLPTLGIEPNVDPRFVNELAGFGPISYF